MSFLLIYKSTISFVLRVLFGGGCRFQPTCSEYFNEAVMTHGIITGSLLGIKRFLRCNPWGRSGFDPVPKKAS